MSSLPNITPKWLSFYLLWWFLNLEYNSTLGNIWYRPDSSGKYVFAYKSILSLLYKPIKQLFQKDTNQAWLWSISFLDVNIYMMLFISCICSYCTYIMYNNVFPTLYNLV